MRPARHHRSHDPLGKRQPRPRRPRCGLDLDVRRLAELDQRRRAAAATVDALLASWRGDAATHFASRWQEWDGAATDVVDALSALLGAIDLARRDLEASDTGSAARGDQLAGRLG